MKRIFITTLLFLISLPAFSTNLRFFNNSSAQYFTKQDWAMFEAAADKALNSSPNGKKTTWKNPASGNFGYLTPLSNTTQNGTRCRKLKMFNSGAERTDEYTFTFCKINNDWQLSENQQ